MASVSERQRFVEKSRTVETLFDDYKQDVFRYVMSMLQDYHAAEDVTQEVFLAVFRHLDQYRGEASMRTWIFAIAKHAVALHEKRRLREPYVVESLPDSPARMDQDTGFYEMVSLLDRPSRDVVVMHLAGRLRHREIAAILCETETAVKKRYARAIAWLREHMKEERHAE